MLQIQIVKQDFEGSLLLGGNRSTSNCTFIGSENAYDFAIITNNTERFRTTTSGNVLINSTTDDTVNKLQVTGGANFTNVNTFSGTISVPNAIPTLLKICDGFAGTGSMFLINAAIGGGGSDRIAMGILVTVSQGGSTARFAFQSNGALITLTDPLANGTVYVTQITGSTQNVSYSILRIL